MRLGGLCWDSNQVVSGQRSYIYCPADPTPAIGGNGIGFLDAGGRDQARLEKREELDVLCYTSDILTVRCWSASNLRFQWGELTCFTQFLFYRKTFWWWDTPSFPFGSNARH